MKYVVNVEDTRGRRLLLTRHVYETYAEAQIAIRKIKEGAGSKQYRAFSVLQIDTVEKTWRR